MIAQQIIEPPSPGFVGVAANVDAPGELHLTGFRILHIEIDVQDQVAHLLHGAPRGPVRAGHLREPALAAVAVADGGPRCDLLDRVRRNVDNLKTARGRELLAQDVIEQADALDLYLCGRLERSIDEFEAEEGNARHFLAVRPRVRSTPRHDGEEDS